jgi:hypothetical protein
MTLLTVEPINRTMQLNPPPFARFQQANLIRNRSGNEV